MSDECTNSRRECDACFRPICRRCSRCMVRRITSIGPLNWKYRCPSWWCRFRKRIRLRPLRRGDTPRTGVCTEGDS